MNKKVVATVIVLLLASIGAYITLNKKSSTRTSENISTGFGNQTTSPDVGLSSTSMNPSFTITGTDDSADHKTIKVKKGASVILTFKVSTNGVYYGGLQFKSTDPVLDSGPIKPGESKVVTFIADKSFSFQPYWPDSQVKKGYTIKVNVE